MTKSPLEPLVAAEGLFILHLFYAIDAVSWSELDEEERLTARARFSATVEQVRAMPDTQLLTFSVIGGKADLGFMLVGPDLHRVNQAEKQLAQGLGPGVLVPAYSYFSMTERSEYTTTEEEYALCTLQKEKGLQPGTEAYENALVEFRSRMEKYGKDRLYPNLPDWPVICFYSMTKRRAVNQNWYALVFEERKRLMAGHARVGRQWAGRIRQLITGSTGLDDEEWGVTLFAKDPGEIKGIVYEMRFDEVSAIYADFGPFYVGLQLAPSVLLDRVLPEAA